MVSEEIAREPVAAAAQKRREGKGGDEERQEQQGERLTSSTNGRHLLFLPLLQPAELRKGSASEVKRTKQPKYERKMNAGAGARALRTGCVECPFR